MKTKERKERLLKAIDRVNTEAAYKAAADICQYRTLKARAEADMETARRRKDMGWYRMRKSAAAACEKAIQAALKTIRGAKPAKNKASTPGMKTKTGGNVIRVK